ncbi:hypothetical protein PFISCL1PPCAC_25746, partial [Pristionchus fissidentatus]
ICVSYQIRFYIIVSNLIAFSSMKAVVELAFVLPYYVMQRDDIKKDVISYFSYDYELAIFNLSVLADYGILFFSVIIAVDRYLTLRAIYSGLCRNATAALCVLGWICAALIPLIFFFCQCQYAFDYRVGKYN